jgi:hypothetical protein
MVAAEFFALSRNPLKDIDCWIVETKRGGRPQGYCLSSRPGAGVDQYEQLRSLRAEEGGVGPPFSQAHPEGQGETATDIGDSTSELGGIRAYFNALIVAARSSLSRADAAAVIRSLRTQKILAMRAAKDRQRPAGANQRNARPEPVAGRHFTLIDFDRINVGARSAPRPASNLDLIWSLARTACATTPDVPILLDILAMRAAKRPASHRVCQSANLSNHVVTHPIRLRIRYWYRLRY